MSSEYRSLESQFDAWAERYDQDVTRDDAFPFAGYERVLATILEQARVSPGMRVLDLGIGTGNLARLFVEAGCTVVGVDFSAAMLAKAQERLPSVRLIKMDLTGPHWPDEPAGPFDRGPYDRIVSNYVLHEFPWETKRAILERLADGYLAPGAPIVVGDVIFPDAAARDSVRDSAGDAWDEEYYWLTDETRSLLEAGGWRVEATQISFCAGVYRLQRRGRGDR